MSIYKRSRTEMERKIQNSTLQLRRLGNNGMMRSSSVLPLLRIPESKIDSSDDNHTDRERFMLELKSSSISLTRRPINFKSKSQGSASPPPNVQNLTKNSKESASSNTKVGKEKQSYSSSTSTPRNEGRKEYHSSRRTLKEELTRCKKELNEHNSATRQLQNKYMKINSELSDMQQKHNCFLAKQAADKMSNSDCERFSSEFSLKRKFTQIFERGKGILMFSGGGTGEPHGLVSFTDSELPDSKKDNHPNSEQSSIIGDNNENININNNNNNNNSNNNSNNNNNNKSNKNIINLDKHLQMKNTNLKNKWCKNKEGGSPNSKCKGDKCSKETLEDFFAHPKRSSSDILSQKEWSKSTSLTRTYQKIQQAIDSEQNEILMSSSKGGLFASDVNELIKTVTQLNKKQMDLCMVIEQQQKQLRDYQARCLSAKRTMETQRGKIEELTKSNDNLRVKMDKDMSELRHRLNAKLEEMIPLSKKLSEAQLSYNHVKRENRLLHDRIRALQNQSKELKARMEELGNRKACVLGKLKNAERDLRVYKNFNAALKTEKQKHIMEIQKHRDELENQKAASKRLQTRQRDQSDKSCRELQQRIFQLEKKLARSSNSTSGVLQQRDRLISELQAQINSLVNNFEVSQKHIRTLRRQIVNAANAADGSNNNINNNNSHNMSIVRSPKIM